MKTSTQRLLAGLLLTTLFAACSRPVAYFQKSPREQFAKSASTSVLPVLTAETAMPAQMEPVVTSTTAPMDQANAALNQFEAVVRNDNQLSTDKTVEKRLNKMRALLSPAAAKASVASSGAIAAKKANLLERMMIRKVNRTINKHLAPANPHKPMASKGILVVGALLAVVGVILLLIGGASSAGVILLLAGAVVLLIGLLL